MQLQVGNGSHLSPPFFFFIGLLVCLKKKQTRKKKIFEGPHPSKQEHFGNNNTTNTNTPAFTAMLQGVRVWRLHQGIPSLQGWTSTAHDKKGLLHSQRFCTAPHQKVCVNVCLSTTCITLVLTLRFPALHKLRDIINFTYKVRNWGRQ